MLHLPHPRAQPTLETSFQGLCVGGPKDGKALASRSRRVTVPFVIRDQPGLGAGYYEFNAEDRIWNWKGI